MRLIYRSALDRLLSSSPYHHGVEPEVPDNGTVRTSFNIIMTLSWALFGILACLDVPTLTLWMVLGGFSIINAFAKLVNEFYTGGAGGGASVRGGRGG